MWNAGLYIRLSKEDENKETNNNSESIENQKELLMKYIKDNNYILYDVYIDDGYTGTNYNRPAFQRMIIDIENKKINMVVVKDLSRLGRDYILTGYYTEMWFPKNRIRFVSLLDNIDSINDINNDILPFKTLINDIYSKDNSKKIRAALRIKQQLGKWVGGCPPFGYMSDFKDKNHLIVNKQESIIVKKIFDIFLEGHSISYISNYLYINKINTPNIIRKINKDSELKHWSFSTIKSILSNQLYTGDLVQNRRRKINYKIKNIIKNNKEDWIIVENAHEQIIKKNVFLEVQKLLNNKNNFRVKNNKLLSGLIFCYECKKRITFQKINNKYYTVCNTYKKKSKEKQCTSHSSRYEIIEQIVIKYIYKYLNKIKVDNIKTIDRSLILKLINKIELHSNSKLDIYFNFNLSPSK